MRKNLVAGNWKMNKSFQEAEELLFQVSDALDEEKPSKVEVVICPPSPYLELATDIADESYFEVGAQNISEHESGAFTGEIAAFMLSSMAVAYTIIGHSERRKYFGENIVLLAEKVNIALKHHIKPIFCCGELIAEREKGKHYEIVRQQISESLFHLDVADFRKVIIAYEPVWAIGTGVNATPSQAQEMHAYIRQLIKEKYDTEIANNTSILYGGSCNANNAVELFSNPDVDGGLIGGASLKADDFMKIVNAFPE